MATRTWTGAINSDLNNNGNWDTVQPTFNDVAVFPAAAPLAPGNGCCAANSFVLAGGTINGGIFVGAGSATLPSTINGDTFYGAIQTANMTIADGTFYGSVSGSIGGGHKALPPPSVVALNVGYGAGGSEFTGEYTGSGSGSGGTQDI